MSAFGGSIPENYEVSFAPYVFELYAADLANRILENSPERILEVAAGTGRVTRALERTLPLSRIVATDINPAMVAQGQGAGGNATWEVADAIGLPFDDASFDVVASQFGVMFYPDKVLGHREARRVLREGGTYYYSCWDSLEQNPWASAIHELMGEMFPENRPLFFATPFSYFDKEAIRQDAADAGFPTVEIDEVSFPIEADPAILAKGVIEGSPLANSLRERGLDDLQPVTDAMAERYSSLFGSHPMRTTMKALVVKATRI